MDNIPKMIFSHPTGNANVRAAVKGLEKEGALHKFITSIATFPGDLMHLLGNIPALKEIHNRAYPPSLQRYTRCYSFYEAGRLAATELGLNSLIEHEKGYFCIDKVYKKFDEKVADKIAQYKENGVTGVYAYEDGAERIFRASGHYGLNCFYDLPTGYWRTKSILLSQAKENQPAWADTMSGLRDSNAKLARKDKELELADHIFVASSFTVQTLEDYPADMAPVHIIPYGFPEVKSSGRQFRKIKNRKLNVLFVGTLTEQKGIAELFEAADKLKDQIELTVVGRKSVDNCEILNRNLAKHRYIPSLPHDEVLQLMREQDLFLFPSLFDGFGLVITEAMSQGTPVITTGRTAGPDLITHGEDGWLIEAGSSEAIVEQVDEILQQPECLQRVGRAAMERAKKRPWEVYGRELAEKVIECST